MQDLSSIWSEDRNSTLPWKCLEETSTTKLWIHIFDLIHTFVCHSHLWIQLSCYKAFLRFSVDHGHYSFLQG